MVRPLLCLPLCLLLAPVYPSSQAGPDDGDCCALVASETPGGKDVLEPIPFLEKWLKDYDANVKSYALTFRKRERINDKVQNLEIIEVAFKEQPHSIFFHWKQGQRKAIKVLYIKGENNDKMLVRPAGILGIAGVVERDLDSADAKQSGRYPITEFGIKNALQKILVAWKEAEKNKGLFVEYLGEQKVPEMNDSVCHVWKRSKYLKPEDDGVTELTLYVDTKKPMQVGTVLKGEKGALIAEYFFIDVRVNPKFADDQFTREAVKRK